MPRSGINVAHAVSRSCLNSPRSYDDNLKSTPNTLGTSVFTSGGSLSAIASSPDT